MLIETGKGGAYGHVWQHFAHKHAHPLFFAIWCLSHVGSNEGGKVLELAGPCVRVVLLKKKDKRGGKKAVKPKARVRTHARTHACTHARTHARTHAHTHALRP